MAYGKSFSGNAVRTTLAAGIDSTATQLSLTADTGWPVGSANRPFVATINRGEANAEKILCAQRTGTTIIILSRGWDGTVAVQHMPGESIEHTIDADTMRELVEHVFDDNRDDHEQYLTQGRHRSPSLHGADSVSHSNIGGLTADDHPQYLNAARHAAAGMHNNAAIFKEMRFLGEVVWLAHSDTPNHPCMVRADGSEIDVSAYPEYASKLGTTWGSAALGKVKLPNIAGRVVIGAGANGSLTTRTHAQTGGTETETLTTAQIPAHGHTGSTSSESTAHTHTGTTDAGGPTFHYVDGDNGVRVAVTTGSSTHHTASSGPQAITFTDIDPHAQHTHTFTTASGGGSHDHDITINNEGGGQAHNNMMPYIVLSPWVCVW